MTGTDVWGEVEGRPAVVRRLSGQGVPLVLVPGCGSDHTGFDALLHALAGFEVCVHCLPGRCGVPGPAPTTATRSAEYLRGALDTFGIHRAFIGGHSYGGAIAIEFALACPERVAGLVLMDTGAKLKAHPEILTGAEAAAAENAVFEANLLDWRACHVFDRLREVSLIQAPTLVIVGADDTLTPPRYAEYLRNHILGAELVLIPGAGHYAPIESAAEVGAAIAHFLRNVSG